MPSALSFDELNRLKTWEELNELVGWNRSEPFKDYFGSMRISDDQKEDRIAFAEKLEDEISYLLAFLFYAQLSKTMPQAKQLQEFQDSIRRVYLEDLRREDAYLKSRAEQMSAETILNTYKHADEAYYYSADRARKLAEEEANTAFNHIEFEEAIDVEGVTHKTWQTAGDNRVRETHDELEGLTIPIEEPFEVGGDLMDYPRDMSYGASDAEIVNCRCSLEYIIGETAKESVEYNVLPDNSYSKYPETADEAQKAADFRKRIFTGDAPISIHRPLQLQHIEGTQERIDRVSRDKQNNRFSSVFYPNVDVDKLAAQIVGKGRIIFRIGNEYPIEYISVEQEIGSVYNFGKKKYVPTRRIAIVYSSIGIHLFPVKEI